MSCKVCYTGIPSYMTCSINNWFLILFLAILYVKINDFCSFTLCNLFTWQTTFCSFLFLFLFLFFNVVCILFGFFCCYCCIFLCGFYFSLFVLFLKTSICLDKAFRIMRTIHAMLSCYHQAMYQCPCTTRPLPIRPGGPQTEAERINGTDGLVDVGGRGRWIIPSAARQQAAHAQWPHCSSWLILMYC